MAAMTQRLQEVGELTRRLQSEFPKETEGFLGFLKDAEDGACIPRKQKELISIALSLAAQCEWCIAFHVQNAVRAGANRSEIIEAGFQAVVMHGGPAFMGMVTLSQAADEFIARAARNVQV